MDDRPACPKLSKKTKKPCNLLQACATGELEQIKKICNSFSDQLDLRDNHNWRPIHHATKYGDIKCLRVLLNHPNIDTKAETFEGCTALQIACELSNTPIEIVQALVIKDKELVQWVNNEEVSPLQLAISNNRLDIVQYLVEEGNANVNYCDLDEEHSLFYAVRKMNINIIRFLLYGTDCNVHLINNNKINALELCLYNRLDDKSETSLACAKELCQFVISKHTTFLEFKRYLQYCWEHDNTFFDIIFTEFYLNPAINEKYIPIIREILNTPEVYAFKYFLVLFLHTRIELHDKDYTCALLIKCQPQGNNPFIQGLYNLYAYARRVFDQYFPLLFSDIGFSFDHCDLNWSYGIIKLFQLNMRIPLDNAIMFLSHLAMFGLDLNYVYNDFVKNYLFPAGSEDNNSLRHVFSILVTFSTKIRPFDFDDIPSPNYLFIESENCFEDYFAYKFQAQASQQNSVPKLYNLCRTRIRDLVFSANGATPHYVKIMKLTSLQIPITIQNYLRYY